MNELPSSRYFELVKTKHDFAMFLGSGIAWVVESNCPATWGGHLELIEERGAE